MPRRRRQRDAAAPSFPVLRYKRGSIRQCQRDGSIGHRQRGAGKGKCVPERAVCPFPVGAGPLPCQDLGVDAVPRLTLERPPVGGLAGRLILYEPGGLAPGCKGTAGTTSAVLSPA